MSGDRLSATLQTKPSILRFAGIGGIGFLLDASILTLLVNGFGVDHYLARAVSFTLAVTATWQGNRRWVFSPTENAGREYAGYLAVQVTGAIINLGVYVVAIEIYPQLARVPVIPLAIGAAVALLFNFFAARRYVFGARAAQQVTPANPGEYNGVENLEVMSGAVNYNAYLIALIHRYQTDGTVLDFGAGTGTFARPLAQSTRQLLCIEPDADLRSSLQASGLTAYADLGEIAPQSLDFVYSLNVLEHIENDQQVLEDLARRLKAGGCLLLYVPAFQILFSAMDSKVGHFRRYRRDQLVAQVRSAGFDVVTSRYVDSLGFFATLLYKLVGDDSGAINASAVILYDRLIFPLSRLLDCLTGRLFGKNLLVVARR